ncbi:MAG: hypothetical protein IT242_08485 [Bacteroidia bacterium]|nr:hypothetical protein [Bacteroidia bacterium]
MKRKFYFLLPAISLFLYSGCVKENASPQEDPQARLVFTFRFDSTLARLDNAGNPDTLPPGHGAQTPVYRYMSANYIELSQDSLKQPGQGRILYRSPETSIAGSNAIDFIKLNIAGNVYPFFTIPLHRIAPGTYKFLRISLAYQNFDIRCKLGGTELTGTVASFLGFNTYITSFSLHNKLVQVFGSRPQGFWAMGTTLSGIDTILTGQSTETTVVNPISTSSPVPAGSGIVTGTFDVPLTISGNETHDIEVTVSLSINKSFEWIDAAGDNIYEPPVDTAVDMGIRGMFPVVRY